ncbi:hypothetical protein WN55_09835 [Dufourea novaeangliae]|uniref:Uncharacterized protein n=1 Tax=Dufourea novaeangliae TaxID=178035 RepID=A0A154P7E6_DUFNO|nr:hypothetical protein WN55_09835 [Dufourea novaeangliae]
MSNSNWLIDEKNSFASMKNSYLQFEDPVNRDPSGSLIPCVSSSYYKCHRHKQSDYQRPGCYIESVGRSGSNLMKQRGSALSTDSSSNKQLEPMNFVSSRHPDNVRSKKHIYQTPSAGSDDSGRVSKCSDQEYRKKVALDNRSDALCIPSTSKAPQMHVVSVNTTVQQQYTGLERTENVMTSAHLIMRNQGSSNEMKKKLRDLDIQCSGFNLRYHQKEVFFRPSVESLLRPSGSEESSVSKSNSDQTRGVGVSKADEKILVVPVFFTDGVPEAPNIPFFKFTKSRHSFPKSSHHVVRVQKKTPSFTHSCLLSDTSAESLEMEDYLRQRLVNKEHWNSGISLSVSRNPSLTCSKHHSRVSTAVSKQTHKCHLIGKHKSPGSMVSDSIRDSRHCFGLTKKGAKRVMPGLRCSPEDFFCDT